MIESSPLVFQRELLAWQFADHHRGMPKTYEAIDIRDGKLPEFSWREDVRGKGWRRSTA